MHAVERGDASILNKLLGMNVGAEVDAEVEDTEVEDAV